MIKSDLFEIPYINSLSGYPGNNFSCDGEYEAHRQREYERKNQLYKEGKISIGEVDYGVPGKPPITMIEHLIENPSEIVDYMPYNHAIGMADIFMMFKGQLKRLLIQPYYLTKEQSRVLNSKVHKIKFYDYWHIHNLNIMKLLTEETVLGWFHLYHVDDRIIRVYFKDKKNKFAYMLFPTQYLQYYGFKINDSMISIKIDRDNSQILSQARKLVNQWKATGLITNLEPGSDLYEMAKLLECEPIQKIESMPNE